MSQCRSLILSMLLPLIFAAQSQQAQTTTRKVEAFRPVLQTLDETGVRGSIAFTGGICKLSNLPEFPEFKKVGNDGASPVQLLREMFAIDPSMRVNQEQDGTVRMTETDVPSDVLNVKIREVRFEGPSAYYPNAALERIVLQVPEFKEFIREHGIRWPYNLDGGFPALGNPNPPAEWPHLAGSLHDVKLSEILDYVAQTFPGVWIYENCPQTGSEARTVWIHFIHYKHHGSAMLIVE